MKPKLKITKRNGYVKDAFIIKDKMGYLNLIINVDKRIREWDCLTASDNYIKFDFSLSHPSKVDTVKVSKKGIGTMLPYLFVSKGQLMILFVPIDQLNV